MTPQMLREYFVWDDSQSISFKCALVSNMVFWPLSFLGFYVDYLAASGKSPLLARCKLQPDKHLSRKEKLYLILLASFNMLFVALVISCPVFEWMWDQMQGPDHRLTESDEWIWHRELLINIPLHAIVAEISFYSVHILLHSSSFLFRHIHKVHHRFVAPTAMTCVYAHPLEFALGNILPIYLGPMITNAHPLTCYLVWFPMAMTGTCKGHSGYRIMGVVDQHDAHHFYFKFNYGGMSVLDSLFGTRTMSHTTEDKKRKGV